MVLVVEYGANKQGAGRLVDLRRRVVHVPLVRIAVLPLQPDLDRDAGKVCGPERKARLGVAPLDRKDLRLAQVEIHVHRVGLHDGRELGRPGRADKGADVDEVMRHGPVEGRNHTGIAEVGLRKLDRRLRVENAGGSLVAVGLRLLEHGLAGKIVLGQGRLPLVLGVVVGEFRLVRGERRLLLVKLGLVNVALDAEQQVALLHLGAVRIVDRYEKALDPGDEIHRIDGRSVSGELEIEGRRLLDRLGDHHFRRRRRNIGVFGVAGRKRQCARCEQNGLGDANKSRRETGFDHTGAAL